MSITKLRRKIIKKLLEQKYKSDGFSYKTANDVNKSFNEVMNNPNSYPSIAWLINELIKEDKKNLKITDDTNYVPYSVEERTILRDLDNICPEKKDGLGYLPKEIYESYHSENMLEKVISEASLGKSMRLNDHTLLVPYEDRNRAQIVLEKSLDALENTILDGVVMEKNIYFVLDPNSDYKNRITKFF